MIDFADLVPAFAFVVDTDQYAGNFERNLVATCDGDAVCNCAYGAWDELREAFAEEDAATKKKSKRCSPQPTR